MRKGSGMRRAAISNGVCRRRARRMKGAVCVSRCGLPHILPRAELKLRIPDLCLYSLNHLRIPEYVPAPSVPMHLCSSDAASTIIFAPVMCIAY